MFDQSDYPYGFLDNNPQDVGYGEYKTLHEYVVEPERIGQLKAYIRAKKQVIQMLTRELMGLEEELENEYRKHRAVTRFNECS